MKKVACSHDAVGPQEIEAYLGFSVCLKASNRNVAVIELRRGEIQDRKVCNNSIPASCVEYVKRGENEWLDWFQAFI